MREGIICVQISLLLQSLSYCTYLCPQGKDFRIRTTESFGLETVFSTFSGSFDLAGPLLKNWGSHLQRAIMKAGDFLMSSGLSCIL